MLEENLDDFKKVTIKLASIGEVVRDEDQVVILLNALPESFDSIIVVIEYGMENLTLRVIVIALRSKELDMKSSNKIMFGKANGDALIARGISDRK